jgi:hypothetical protein
MTEPIKPGCPMKSAADKHNIIARQFERVVEQHLAAPLTISAICQMIGIPDRTPRSDAARRLSARAWHQPRAIPAILSPPQSAL